MSPTIANAGTIPTGSNGIAQSWTVTSYSYGDGTACNDDCGGSGYDSANLMASAVIVPFPYTCGSGSGEVRPLLVPDTFPALIPPPGEANQASVWIKRYSLQSNIVSCSTLRRNYNENVFQLSIAN